MKKSAELYSVTSYLIFALAAFIAFFTILNAQELMKTNLGIISMLLGFFLDFIVIILRMYKQW